MTHSNPRVFVALDFDNPMRAVALADRLDPRACGLKVGSEMFAVAGPEPVRWMVERGFNVFLDLKFHDIPNTVAQACAVATRLGVFMLNVHAAGGRAMLVAAREAVDRASRRAAPREACSPSGGSERSERGGRHLQTPPLLIAVTVLTSLNDADLRETGHADGATAQAVRLATLARDCGLDGVVCSAVEAPAMRHALGREFKLVTPGIRPAGASVDDQARIITPEAAVANGADYLVVGRPITRAADPVAALAAINRSIGVAG